MEGAGAEAQLVARCRAAEPNAWESLVEHFSGYVYAIVSRGYRLADADAEDVFQEVFARLFENLDSIRDDASIRFWIGQTARRLAIDRLRRGERETVVDPDGGLERIAAPDLDLERLDLALDLRAGVDALPERCREVIIRFFIRDESYRAIGEAMEIPAGTIASRISRCLSTLREELGER